MLPFKTASYTKYLERLQYGDWSQVLQKHATAMFKDEFMTSKFFSQCYRALSFVRYNATTTTEEGDTVNPQKSKTRYEVLRYNHVECSAKYSNYDASAAINMLALTKSELRGDGRMEAFRRAEKA